VASSAAQEDWTVTNDDSAIDPVGPLAEDFVARYRKGERPPLSEYIAKHPELADRIRQVFPLLAVMEEAGPEAALSPSPAGTAKDADHATPLCRQVGDYRILREVGRGGMGVVYEAEQESLGRRVALKVLHLHAGQDQRLLTRFRRESRAAAQLHHTNIVPVFEVGQQGDLCYYAMQFIRGQALDEVFRELQHLRESSAAGAAGERAASASCRSVTMDHELGPAPGAEPVVRPAPSSAAALPDHSELSSVTSNYRRYCRNVARLGLQAAEALAYAHARGIIHRDIKPANLLLDSTGVLWVSDFGLVKTQDPALTDTGDLVGTLRYMAPERFRGECDARADVYALGLTMYELLVLRPAFAGQDRMHLVDQIGHQEPARLRVLDPRIPRDLETIVMKAIEKEPRRRYASTEDLADDLRHFLADEPIRARRIGPLERLGRWGRRNPLVAGLSAAVVVLAALGFIGLLGQWQMAMAQEQQAKDHATKVEQERDQVQALNEQLRATQVQLRNTLYAAQLNLAKHAWDAGGIGRVQELLEQHLPKPGEPDLRGFEWFYLRRLCHQEILTLRGHIDRVNEVAFSTDGKRLASTSEDDTVKVWDAQTGQELFSLKGGGRSVAFSPDGKRLASTGDGPVRVWDAQTGRELLSLKDGYGGIAFSPDGKRLACAYGDNAVEVWDAQTGRELLTCKGHTDSVTSVAFSPDGRRLAGASWDNAVKVWDAQTGQEILSLQGQGEDTRSVAFSPDGKRLACASADDTVKVWDAQTGRELLSLEYPAAGSVAFSPDGKRLASGSWRGMLRIWDLQTGKAIRTFKGGGGSVVFSPDGKRLASNSEDKTVKVWDAQKDQESLTLQEAGGTFSPDWRRLASASTNDNTITLRDAPTGQPIVTFKGHPVRIRSMAFSPDGKRLASGGGGQKSGGVKVGDRAELKVWDTQTGQELLSLPVANCTVIKSVAFSPDGKRLASGTGPLTNPGEVKVWDAQTGQELLSLKTGAGTSVAFSPDGKRLASASHGGTVKVWDAQTGQQFLSFETHSTAGSSVAFSPDGKRLASGGRGGVKVWDAQTGQELLTLKGHTGGVAGVAFSPDGKRLASVSYDKTVKVWDAQTGEELLSLHTPWPSRVVFCPDGKRLASMGDGTVTIWDATPLPERP
jgi:WD40 repeat protein/serine/threonine protein kinase